jgi:hypothetical protein
VKILPPEPTIEALKREAGQCEQTAGDESESRASKLREKAALLREWIAVLKTGKWTS